MQTEIKEEFRSIIRDINNYYKSLRSLTNDKIRDKVCQIQVTINSSDDISNALDEKLPEVFAIVKETARRFAEGNIIVQANDNDKRLSEYYDFVKIEDDKAVYINQWNVCGVLMKWNMIHYDEQLLGGILLHRGYATEMATGEGKTLVATLPVFLNALTHQGVHLMTVNDYLSKRDFETTRPLYMFHGLSADCIEYYTRDDNRRKKAYQSDITFGTNSSFTFDYLFDHIAISPNEVVQQKHNFAIIDELDSILIDNADEPHIVGGGNRYNCGEIYKKNFPIIKELIEQKDHYLFTSNKLNKSASFTDAGKRWLAEKKGILDLYEIERIYEITNFDNMQKEEQDVIKEKLYLQNVFLQLLFALTVYEKDEDYIVEGGKVKIIDQHTGRVRETSRWEHGLHTAIEVKENVAVEDDFDGMAVISLKNYFRLYSKIAGMSGTIMPAQDELSEIYGLKCESVPTHKPMIRKDYPLRVFRTSAVKDKAIVSVIMDNQKKGRPTLVGNITIKRSEALCAMLDEHGVKYNRLDAKTIKGEALIVEKAGIGNTITVSTSVAGRGTDIKPSIDAIDNGGLLVIGTDLFESVRIDKQLKGRSGRQGDPGSSVFFASLEDSILKNLSDEDFKQLKALANESANDEIMADGVISYFMKAQTTREDYFKKRRQETARKDDIIAPQRRKFYNQRNAILFNADMADGIIAEILQTSKICMADIDSHLQGLYYKVKELIIRSTRNNPNRKQVYVPFSDNMHTFAILLEVEQTKISYVYFCKEFKRQVILQIYDKEWKKFVIYMMGNLDRKEVEMLNDRYCKMQKEINAVILSRLISSSIPFEFRNKVIEKEKTSDDKKVLYPKPIIVIDANAPCPCGSGKKFCECHGSNIRSNNRLKRRR